MFKELYLKNKVVLLEDKKINKNNLELFKKFFEIEEEKLKRTNDNPLLDESSYKTLLGYINKFRNVNAWFKNKAWEDLTEAEIKKVYDDLEDGKITNRFGKRFGDRRGYYSKVFRSLPFKLAGKSQEVLNALTFYTDRRKREVHFVNEEGFKKVVSVISKPEHLCLLWLSWDIGENINTLLELQASNFKKQINKETKEEEYRVWLPQNKLKRSRQERSELTLFPETTKYLDIVLQGLKPTDKLFKFEYRQALKIFQGAVKRAKVVCEPTGKAPSWKDLRSGMACNLFQNYNWTSDDINLRLGHNITSKELESYFSYCANRRSKTKKQHFDSNVEGLNEQLNEMKIREKTNNLRVEELSKALEELQREIKERKSKK